MNEIYISFSSGLDYNINAKINLDLKKIYTIESDTFIEKNISEEVCNIIKTNLHIAINENKKQYKKNIDSYKCEAIIKSGFKEEKISFFTSNKNLNLVKENLKEALR